MFETDLDVCFFVSSSECMSAILMYTDSECMSAILSCSTHLMYVSHSAVHSAFLSDVCAAFGCTYVSLSARLLKQLS